MNRHGALFENACQKETLMPSSKLSKIFSGVGLPKTATSPQLNALNKKKSEIGLRLFNFNSCISLVNKYLYLEVPKAACSTIKLTLINHEGSRVNETFTHPHLPIVNSPHIKPYQLTPELLEEVYFGDDIFRFSFVRNPYGRCLSAYLDTIVNKKNPFLHMCKALKLDPEVDLSFSEFLSLQKEYPVSNWDKHWQPQTFLLIDDLVKLHFVGKIESFNHDWAQARKMSKKAVPALGKDVVWHSTGADEKIKEYYSENDYRLVNELYGKDFETYGYPLKG